VSTFLRSIEHWLAQVEQVGGEWFSVHIFQLQCVVAGTATNIEHAIDFGRQSHGGLGDQLHRQRSIDRCRLTDWKAMTTPEQQSVFQVIVSRIESDVDAVEVDITIDDEAVVRFFALILANSCFDQSHQQLRLFELIQLGASFLVELI